jgi:hypothetical protein
VQIRRVAVWRIQYKGGEQRRPPEYWNESANDNQQAASDKLQAKSFA